MSVEKQFLIESLLQFNYLPTQKKFREELPPAFSTIKLTPNIAFQLTELPNRSGDFCGYDQCEYKLTRFDNVSRNLSIPHPLAHCKLAFTIYDIWDKLEYITKNSNSIIKPQTHADGRLIIMNYEKSLPKSIRMLNQSFGNKFRAHADISSCFPSIYSHALSWALIGFENSKKSKGNKFKNAWFNKLDESLRLTKRNETQGVAIGPATSNIVSEIILARVDEKLRMNFKFVRFIDDYTCDCYSESEAQNFIRQLTQELAKYKLNLNAKKTKIKRLPSSQAEEWVLDLATKITGKEITSYDAIQYLDYAVALASKHPEGSVLKFAFKTLVNKKLDFMAKFDVLRYGLTLSFHSPVLLPYLDQFLEDTWILSHKESSEKLNLIIKENSVLQRSDGMCWGIYLLCKLKASIDENVAINVLETGDALSILMLYWTGQFDEKVLHFYNALDKTDLYALDNYWLLIYQLFYDEMIVNPYPDKVFSVLKTNNVSFFEPPTFNPNILNAFDIAF